LLLRQRYAGDIDQRGWRLAAEKAVCVGGLCTGVAVKNTLTCRTQMA
jgi:hypothetical protein